MRLDDIARRGQLPCVIRAGGRDKADVSRFSRSACLDYEIFLFEGALPRILYSARPGPAGYSYFTSGRLDFGRGAIERIEIGRNWNQFSLRTRESGKRDLLRTVVRI